MKTTQKVMWTTQVKFQCNRCTIKCVIIKRQKKTENKFPSCLIDCRFSYQIMLAIKQKHGHTNNSTNLIENGSHQFIWQFVYFQFLPFFRCKMREIHSRYVDMRTNICVKTHHFIYKCWDKHCTFMTKYIIINCSIEIYLCSYRSHIIYMPFYSRAILTLKSIESAVRWFSAHCAFLCVYNLDSPHTQIQIGFRSLYLLASFCCGFSLLIAYFESNFSVVPIYI